MSDKIDIDSMKAGKELDRLVAEKVMGWKLGLESRDDDPSDYPNGFISIQGIVYIPKGAFDRWMPSTNIADAWLVGDRIKSLTKCNGKLHCTREPWMSFCKHLTGAWGDKDGFNINFWDVNPESICKASVKAINDVYYTNSGG